MRALTGTLLLVLFSCSLIWAQFSRAPIYVNTGEGLSALNWRGIGAVILQTGYDQRLDLSSNLPRTFTFETWFQTPVANDGKYKTIVTRYKRGTDGTWHNRWADFNLQVQTDATLNFFGGNGFPSQYGFNLGTLQVESNLWYHVAFTLVTLPGQLNPFEVRVVVNGQQEFSQPWAGVGNRQEYRCQPIVLGDYLNQDGDIKNWNGYLDEVRFWAGTRTLDQLRQYSFQTVKVPFAPEDSGVPLAYYRFNEGAGKAVLDSSPNQRHGYIRPNSSISWALSGVRQNVFGFLNHTESKTFVLPGASVNNTFGFTYTITSLPSDASGNQLGALSTTDGRPINTVPFSLLDNKVVFTAPPSANVRVSFTFKGVAPLVSEDIDTTYTLYVGDESCDSQNCALCPLSPRAQALSFQGCSCLPLPYFGYNYSDIERIVFLFEVEKTLDLLTQLESKVETLMNRLAHYPTTYDLVVLINELQAFNRQCLKNFCERFTLLLANVGNPTFNLPPLSY